jgi:hypothetical protein
MADRWDYFRRQIPDIKIPNMEKERRILDAWDIGYIARTKAEPLRDDFTLTCIDGRSYGKNTAGIGGADAGGLGKMKAACNDLDISITPKQACEIIIEAKGGADFVYGHTSQSDTGSLLCVSGCGHCMGMTKPNKLKAYGLKPGDDEWMVEAYEIMKECRIQIIKYPGTHQEGALTIVRGNVFLPHNGILETGEDWQSFIYNVDVDRDETTKLADTFSQMVRTSRITPSALRNLFWEKAQAQIQKTAHDLAVFEGRPLPVFEVSFANPRNPRNTFKVTQLS